MQILIVVLLIFIVPTIARSLSYIVLLRKLRFGERTFKIIDKDELDVLDQKILKLGMENLKNLGFREWAYEKANICGYDPKFMHTSIIMHATVRNIEVYAFINQALMPNKSECPLSIDFLTVLEDQSSIITGLVGDNMMFSQIKNRTYNVKRVKPSELLEFHLSAVAEKKQDNSKLFSNPEELGNYMNECQRAWLEYHISNESLVKHPEGGYVYSSLGMVQPCLAGLKFTKYYHSVKEQLVEDEEAIVADVEFVKKQVVYNNLFEDTPSYFSKKETFGIFIVSFIFAAASFLFLQFDFQTLLMILAIIFIHELGHAIGMLIFGYKNVKFYFLPFFGGFATGKKPEGKNNGEILMLFLGPVPGIIISCIIYLLHERAMISKESILMTYASLSLIINVTNLLPIEPLDGGKICNIILFSRFPKLQTVFMLFSGLILVLTFNVILCLIGVGIILNIKRYWQINHVVSYVRKLNLQNLNEVLFAISDDLKILFTKKTESFKRLEIVKNILSQSKTQPISLFPSCVYLGIYTCSLCVLPMLSFLNQDVENQKDYEEQVLNDGSSPDIYSSGMTYYEDDILIYGDIPRSKRAYTY